MKKIILCLSVLLGFTMNAQLISVTENSKTGQRLTVSNVNNHGDIGSEAVDLSYSPIASSTMGATGNYSVAMGYNTTASSNYSTAMGASTAASGDYSTAMGGSTTASGGTSTAMGGSTTASGDYSTAMGKSTTASGNYSTAMGKSTTASALHSTAMGTSTTASGGTSTAMGYATTASGGASTAMGSYTTASGTYSTAMGGVTTASGNYSTAMGRYTNASDYASLTVGQYNSVNSAESAAGSSATTFNTTNVAFVIGNGISGALSDAFVVKFNGDATLAGDLTINSDERLKDNIQPLGSTLNKLHQIEAKTYSFKKDEEHTPKIGVLAQEVQAVFPELVTEGADGILSVNYQGLVPVLINAINEQDAKIAALEEMVRFLAVQQSQTTSSVAAN